MKNLMAKKPSKKERKQSVLLAVVDLYIKTNTPVGSETLRQKYLRGVSSATIRNYFVTLEKEGFLQQPHSSGGRVPTKQAYRFYADYYQNEPLEKSFFCLKESPTKELIHLLHHAAQTLSEETSCPIFLSTPIFEMDFVQTVRFLLLEQNHLLCVVITDFGLIHTETFYPQEPLSQEDLALLESYFYWRLGKGENPVLQREKLLKTAQRLYSELMVRFIVYSSSLQEKSLFHTGLSKLLLYPEFAEASTLAIGLSLFENRELMQKLLRQSMRGNSVTYFIGEDFLQKECSVLLMPYSIHHNVAGAFGLLGPLRLPYQELFQKMRTFAKELSYILTKNVYKFRVSFKSYDDLQTENHVEACSSILLEDKSQ
ncbi:MAG: heat-inducible transcriptional repressor HrcA [Chlamydiota bacterium]